MAHGDMKATTRRPRHRRAKPALPPLPQLSRPLLGAEQILTITTLQVYDSPWCRGGAGTHWIVAVEPRRHIGEGDLIVITANLDRRTGAGRISHVSGLDKHWATFSISGAIPKAGIRIPIPWAKLPRKAAEAHARAYLSLESIPPHPIFREDSWYRNPNMNPYWTALYATTTTQPRVLSRRHDVSATTQAQPGSNRRADAPERRTREVQIGAIKPPS